MSAESLNAKDPIKRNVEKDTSACELSPMDPPDAYKPPSSEAMAVEDMHPMLQELIADHEAIKSELEKFEATIISMREKGVDKDTNERLREFFEFFNETFIAHDKREEKDLFPALAEKLIEKGEHSHGPTPTTAVDVMEDDHMHAVQLAAVIFNFFALASRLRDEVSRNIVLDAAIEKANELIEMLRLHIFREDTILFPLAHKLIDASVLTSLQERRKQSV